MYVDLPNPFPSLPCIFNTLLPLVPPPPLSPPPPPSSGSDNGLINEEEEGRGGEGTTEERGKNREKRESAKKKSLEEQGEKFAMFYPFFSPGGDFGETTPSFTHTNTLQQLVRRDKRKFSFFSFFIMRESVVDFISLLFLLRHFGKEPSPPRACCVRNKKNF